MLGTHIVSAVLLLHSDCCGFDLVHLVALEISDGATLITEDQHCLGCMLYAGCCFALPAHMQPAGSHALLGTAALPGVLKQVQHLTMHAMLFASVCFDSLRVVCAV